MTFDQVRERLRRDDGIRVGHTVMVPWARFNEWSICDGETVTSYNDEASAINAFLEAIA